MAATINTRRQPSPSTAIPSSTTTTAELSNSNTEIPSSLNGAPILLCRIEGQPARVNGAVLLPRDEGIVTVSDDHSIRVWLRRDSGQFWPSICHFLPFAATAIDYSQQTSRLYVGQLNGVISEFLLAEDLNSLRLTRTLPAHSIAVSCVRFSLQFELVVSTGKDKMVVWHCSESGVKMGCYECDAWCTALQLDSTTRYVFVGDYSGNVLLLNIADSGAHLISKLSAHTGAIQTLAWDHQRQLLFSGSTDNLVIMWDIGGRRGQAFEMTGHTSSLSSLAVACARKRLFSADQTGALLCWDVDAHRVETPEWRRNDSCEQCDSPFFWNLRTMWDRRVVGLRQHHCRLCGRAVCTNCSQHSTKYPPMGYELAVRICDRCHGDMVSHPDRFDLTPLAVRQKVCRGISCMFLDETGGRLLTVGADRVLMIWNVKSLVC